LKCVEISHENPRVNGLRVLRVGLVAHFAHLHVWENKKIKNEDDKIIILDVLELRL